MTSGVKFVLVLSDLLHFTHQSDASAN